MNYFWYGQFKYPIEVPWLGLSNRNAKFSCLVSLFQRNLFTSNKLLFDEKLYEKYKCNVIE